MSVFSATTALYVGSNNYSAAYVGDVKVWPLSNIRKYLTFDILSGGTIQLSGNCASAQTVQYRVNNGSWTNMRVCGATASDAINVSAGDVVEWKGTNNTYGYEQSYIVYRSTFSGTCFYNVSGRILSLFYGDDAEIYNVFPLDDYGLRPCGYLFGGSGVISAGRLSLPSTTVKYCYWEMFNNCSSLTTAPELPATALAYACYADMFFNCSSLTTAPELPATTLARSCYSDMFYGCSSLTAAPELPATTLADDCYNTMFYGCESLCTAPELPATALTIDCYQSMFHGCSSLTTAPELPATTLALGCYWGMFYGCTSLTTAPELPAPILVENCYGWMFGLCRSLNYIKCLATSTGATDCTKSWVSNVSVTGTFVKKGGVSWPTGVNGIPSGWTVNSVVDWPGDYFYPQPTAGRGLGFWISAVTADTSMVLNFTSDDCDGEGGDRNVETRGTGISGIDTWSPTIISITADTGNAWLMTYSYYDALYNRYSGGYGSIWNYCTAMSYIWRDGGCGTEVALPTGVSYSNIELLVNNCNSDVGNFQNLVSLCPNLKYIALNSGNTGSTIVLTGSTAWTADSLRFTEYYCPNTTFIIANTTWWRNRIDWDVAREKNITFKDGNGNIITQ